MLNDHITIFPFSFSHVQIKGPSRNILAHIVSLIWSFFIFHTPCAAFACALSTHPIVHILCHILRRDTYVAQILSLILYIHVTLSVE